MILRRPALPRMKTVVVTDQHQEWFEIADAAVVTARRYLAETGEHQ